MGIHGILRACTSSSCIKSNERRVACLCGACPLQALSTELFRDRVWGGHGGHELLYRERGPWQCLTERDSQKIADHGHKMNMVYDGAESADVQFSEPKEMV